MLTLYSPVVHPCIPTSLHPPGGVKQLPNNSFKMHPLRLAISEGTGFNKWLQSPGANEKRYQARKSQDAYSLPRFPAPHLVAQSQVRWAMPRLSSEHSYPLLEMSVSVTFLALCYIGQTGTRSVSAGLRSWRDPVWHAGVLYKCSHNIIESLPYFHKFSCRSSDA